MKMSKAAFLKNVAAIYRMGNITDHETNPNTWTNAEMAHDVCSPLDQMMRRLVDGGVLTNEEHQAFYDTL
jgi:hypothetical protein